MHTTFEDLVTAGQLDVYVDDIVIMTDDPQTHQRICEIVRDRLKQAGVLLNGKKIQHFQTEVRLLGHVISHNSIRPVPEYTDGLQQRQMPTTAAQRRTFNGGVAWIAKFVPNCAKLLAAFNGDPCERNFQAVLDAVRNHVALSPMVPGQPLHLYTDASSDGWGGALLQNNRILGCAGGKWQAGERNWLVREQEIQAVIRSLRHFSYYCTGALVHVHTDHSANTSLRLHKRLNQSKLLNWLAELSSWSILWHHVPGSRNGLADWLSRDPPPSEAETLEHVEQGRIRNNNILMGGRSRLKSLEGGS